MPTPYPFLDLHTLQQAVSRTGKDLSHLRTIDQRVKQQIRDLARQTELRPEIIEQRQYEARHRALNEAEAYVKSEKIGERLAAIAAQPAHYSMSAFLARGFVVAPPELGTLEGPAGVKLQAAMLAELMAIKWAITLPGLPLAGLEELVDVTIQTANYPLQSLIYAEVNRRIEEGSASESQRTALTLMKHKLEREEPAPLQEAKALIAEAERLGRRIEQTLFAIRSGESDVGARVDDIAEARKTREAEKWQARDNTNPHTTAHGAPSQPLSQGSSRGQG